MKTNRIAAALAALAVVGAYLFIQHYRGPAASPSSPPEQKQREVDRAANPPRADRHASAPGSPAKAGVGFRSRAALDDHFKKHGHEFGGITIDEYLAKAQTLRDAAVGGSVLELR